MTLKKTQRAIFENATSTTCDMHILAEFFTEARNQPVGWGGDEGDTEKNPPMTEENKNIHIVRLSLYTSRTRKMKKYIGSVQRELRRSE